MKFRIDTSSHSGAISSGGASSGKRGSQIRPKKVKFCLPHELPTHFLGTEIKRSKSQLQRNPDRDDDGKGGGRDCPPPLLERYQCESDEESDYSSSSGDEFDSSSDDEESDSSSEDDIDRHALFAARRTIFARRSQSQDSNERDNSSETGDADVLPESASDDTDDIPSEAEILRFGLLRQYFSEKRQQRVRQQHNIDRFKSAYGVWPKSARALFKDLKKDFPDIDLEHCLLCLSWLKLYEKEIQLSGKWDFCEQHIREKVKAYARMIQSLKPKKIVFGGWDDDEIYILTVDGVNFKTQEFRSDPSAKWYDHKSKSSGLTYQFACAIRHNQVVWIEGPIPAGSKHDITIFRGGTKEQPKDNWDQNAMYFKLPPGKKAVGDSGYTGEPEKVVPSRAQHSSQLRKFLGRAKNRQETFHGRLKSFNVLGERFRNNGRSTQEKLDLHKTCVEAVCVIVQYDLENGSPLFDI